MKVWSREVAQDYDSLKIFGCPAYYHVKEDKLNLRARKGAFLGFKRSVKCYMIWDPKDKKTILSENVTFDEASMVKPTDHQQVESKKSTGALQWVESNATQHTPDSSVSSEIPPIVTQDKNYVEDQGQVIGQV